MLGRKESNLRLILIQSQVTPANRVTSQCRTLVDVADAL